MLRKHAFRIKYEPSPSNNENTETTCIENQTLTILIIKVHSYLIQLWTIVVKSSYQKRDPERSDTTVEGHKGGKSI